MSKKISIILPVLNEEEAIRPCLEEIKDTIQQNNLDAEVIVVNNNSTDNSAQIIRDISSTFPEIKIVGEKNKGYGSAYKKGFSVATGKYIYMADCDGTYDFSEIPLFIKKLNDGYDLVVGNRFSGKMDKEAMQLHKRYLGNPFLSFLTRLFFKIRIHDIHCGARGVRKKVYENLNLRTSGMEFASEMIVKAAKQKYKIGEIPIRYRKRIGKSKLESLADGWRHLRFLLLYSPLILFLLPGVLLFVTGSILMSIFYFGNPNILGIELYFHPMFLFSTMIIVGYQLILFSMFSKIYAIEHLRDVDPAFEKLFKIFTIEKAGIIGILLILIGAIIYGVIFHGWIESGLNSMNEIKDSIVALTLVVLGAQTFSSTFMLSMLGIREN